MLKIYKGFVFLKYFNETNFIIKNSELLLLNFTNSLNLRLIFNEKTNKTAEMRYISAVCLLKVFYIIISQFTDFYCVKTLLFRLTFCLFLSASLR